MTSEEWISRGFSTLTKHSMSGMKDALSETLESRANWKEEMRE